MNHFNSNSKCIYYKVTNRHRVLKWYRQWSDQGGIAIGEMYELVVPEETPYRGP